MREKRKDAPEQVEETSSPRTKSEREALKEAFVMSHQEQRHELGRVLQDARKGRSLQEVAEMLPVGASTLSRWEAGKWDSALHPAYFPAFLEAYAPSDESVRERIVDLYFRSYVWDAFRVIPGTLPSPKNEDAASFDRLWKVIMTAVWPCSLDEAEAFFATHKITGEGFRLERVRLLGFLVGAGVSIFKAAEILNRQSDFHAWRPIELYRALENMAGANRPFPWVDALSHDLGVWSVGYFINVSQRTLADALSNSIVEWCHGEVDLAGIDVSMAEGLFQSLGKLKAALKQRPENQQSGHEEDARSSLTYLKTSLAAYGSPGNASMRLNYYKNWYGQKRLETPSISKLEEINDAEYTAPEYLAEFASIIFGRSHEGYDYRRQAIREDDMVIVEWLCTFKALQYVGQLVKVMLQDTARRKLTSTSS